VPESLEIDAPSASLALALVERMSGLHAKVMPDGEERFRVKIELDGRPGADRLLLDSLDRIEGWLESSGLAVAEIHLNGHTYCLERRAGTPLPQRAKAELDGLVCKVRKIPLGSGVQVISVEGELDLHTAEKLEDAVESTDSSRVVVDLTEVPFIDSTALAVVIAASKRLRKEERELGIAAGNPTVSRVLSITGLDRSLNVRSTLSEAIGWALVGAVTASIDGR
jgi:anti-sigma B factor antagonist